MFCDPKCGPGGTQCRGRCQRSSLGCLVRCFYVCPWKILFKHTRFVYSKSKGQRSSETGLVRARRATSMVSCPPPPKLCPWSTFVVLETLVVAGTTHHIRSFEYFARCQSVLLSSTGNSLKIGVASGDNTVITTVQLRVRMWKCWRVWSPSQDGLWY